MDDIISGGDRDADTIQEFAARNRISRAQTYEEIRAGRLNASKVGSRTIITRENGAAWRRALPTIQPAELTRKAASDLTADDSITTYGQRRSGQLHDGRPHNHRSGVQSDE